MSAKSQNTRLRMDVRIAERRPAAEFELREGETLNQRVQKEIDEAVAAGNINSLSTRPTVPPIAVYEVDDQGEPVGGSIAIYDYQGRDLNHRSYAIKSGKDGEGKMVYKLTCLDEDENGDVIEKVVGIFYDNNMAEKIGTFWSAGVLD